MSRSQRPRCEKTSDERRRERDEAIVLSSAVFVCFLAMFVAVFS